MPWLGSSDKEMSNLVEAVTKAGGLYPDESFTILTNISVQCQGGDKWNFSTTTGAARFATYYNPESSVIYLHSALFQLQLAGCQETSPQVKVELNILPSLDPSLSVQTALSLYRVLC